MVTSSADRVRRNRPSGRFDRGDTFPLQIHEDLFRLRRADDASALDALEHDAVQSTPELNVALAYGALAGEYHCLLHVACLHFLVAVEMFGVGVFNQKAPILDRGFSWE